MFERSFHFVPGDRPEWFVKAVQAGADAVVFDLEDAVAESRKASAAEALIASVPKIGSACLTFVRVNGNDSAVITQENRLLEGAPQLGVIFPKVESASHFQTLLNHYPAAATRKIIILIESNLGVENCAEILACRRPYGVGIGLEDMLTTSVFARDDLSDFVRYVRCRVALAGAALGCLAIDTVSLDTSGGPLFARDAEEARSCGLQAKFTIHPSQIRTANRIFAPDPKAVEQAKEILTSVGSNMSIGYGVLNGRIISPPTLAKARLLQKFAKTYATE